MEIKLSSHSILGNYEFYNIDFIGCYYGSWLYIKRDR